LLESTIGVEKRAATPVYEANTAAINAFERIRKTGLPLSDLLTKKLPVLIADQPSSNLMMQKVRLTNENDDLSAKVANLQGIAKETCVLKREGASLKKQLDAKKAAQRAPEFVSKEEWAK